MKWFIFLFLVSGLAQAQETNVSTESLSEYQNNHTLRKERKFGAGVGVGGPSGSFGGLIELNIEDENSALVGFGTGSGYHTMHLAWKHSFEGEYFTPYTTAGYAHWWDSGNRHEANRSSLLKNFLSKSQKDKNNFGLDLAMGSVGMQFNQLAGELAGSSFYIELGALLSIERPKLMPTGAVGALYYF